MHTKNPEIIERIHLSLFSASDDGMHLEVTKGDEQGNEIDREPILTFREDEMLGIQLVIHRGEKDIIIPLSEFKKAIKFAEKEVHSESFYDKKTINN